MGFRARKSIKLGPGLRLTASRSGLGISAGTRGARYSVHSSGRHTASVGVPGTGLGYTTSRGGGRSRSRQQQAPVNAASPPKPGLLAPAHEKAFYKALHAYMNGETADAARLFREASAKDTKDKALSDEFFAGLISAQTGDDETAIALLEKVVQDPRPLPDELMAKYVEGGELLIRVTENVRVEVPFGSLAAVLTLAECYQGLRSRRRRARREGGVPHQGHALLAAPRAHFASRARGRRHQADRGRLRHVDGDDPPALPVRARHAARAADGLQLRRRGPGRPSRAAPPPSGLSSPSELRGRAAMAEVCALACLH